MTSSEEAQRERKRERKSERKREKERERERKRVPAGNLYSTCIQYMYFKEQLRYALVCPP